MKKRMGIIIAMVLILALSTMVFVACNKKDDDKGNGESYTVKFNLNYPDATGKINDQTVKKGEKIDAPTVPSRSGYVLRSWYKDAELNQPFNIGSETIDKDTTLYAGWSSSIYYVAGNFTGYEAKKEGFNMHEVVGKEGWFSLVVDLNEDNRDTAYDGHYYKITNGTWNADGTWGVDNYALQPAPVSPTGGGLGSIFIYENGTVTINFDSNNVVIYDNTMVREYATPRIYGDFNTAMDRGSDWSLKDAEALTLTHIGGGVYSGLYRIPAGQYLMAVAISEKYYIDEWGNRWGTEEQYKFDGTPAGMAGTSTLSTNEEAIYEFKYDSATNITTVSVVEGGDIQDLVAPTIYGEFSGWLFEGKPAIVLTKENGKYTGTLELNAYTGEGEGYMFAVGISKKLYDDEWGIRWGMEEQYRFDGEPAGMAGLSYLKPTAKTIYRFSYDSQTHITTVTIVD